MSTEEQTLETPQVTGEDPGINAVPEVDFDALGQPDQVQESDGIIPSGPVSSEEDILDQEVDASQLTDLDKQLDAEMGNVDSVEEQPESTEIAEEPQAAETTEESQPQETAGDDYFMKPFNDLKEKFGDDFNIPEDVTADNYMEKLYGVMNRNLDPRIEAMQKAVDEGGDLNQVIQSYNQSSAIDTMDSKDLMSQALKQQYNWDDEKIQATIDKMDNSGALEIEAERVRENYKNYQSQQEAVKQQQEIEQRTRYQEQQTQERGKQIDDTLKYIDTLDNVYGIPVSKAEKSEFSNFFREVTTPDKDGNAPLMDLLQSNENLAKIAFTIFKGDDKMRNAISNAKSGAKSDLVDRLDSQPKTSKKGAQPNAGHVDFDALAAPERFG
tara:strand:+ start:5189 stop:6337 length:1149 start_codon:yes stop_codon:yes gene_type:complete